MWNPKETTDNEPVQKWPLKNKISLSRVGTLRFRNISKEY